MSRTALRSRNLLGVLAGLLLLLGTVLGWAPVAAAHDELVGSDPVAGTALDAAPAQVTLSFSGEVRSAYAQVAVLGPDGAHLEAGPPSVVQGVLTQPVGAPASGGELRVSYRVVSADGHPISGTYTFTVAAAPPPATPVTAGPVPADQATDPPGATDPAPGDAATPSVGPGAPSATPAAAAADAGPGRPAVVGLAAVGLVALAGGAWAIRRRRPT